MSTAEKIRYDMATEADYEQIGSILLHANAIEADQYDRGLVLDDYELQDLLDRLKMILRDSEFGICFTAKAGTKVVGLVVCYVNGRRGFIQDIWVEKSVRGGRQCSELMNRAMEYFEYRRCWRVNCSTAVQNESVRKMLVKRGFREISVNFQTEVEA